MLKVVEMDRIYPVGKRRGERCRSAVAIIVYHVILADRPTLSNRTLVMENKGTISIVSSSARKVSSSGVRPGCKVLGRAMVRWREGVTVHYGKRKSCCTRLCNNDLLRSD